MEHSIQRIILILSKSQINIGYKTQPEIYLLFVLQHNMSSLIYGLHIWKLQTQTFRFKKSNQKS